MAFEGPLYIDFKFDSRRACLPAYEALKLAISLSRWALTGVKIECLNELHTPGGVDQVHCREPAVRALPASTFAGRSKRPIARSGPSCAASREGGAGESGPACRRKLLTPGLLVRPEYNVEDQQHVGEIPIVMLRFYRVMKGTHVRRH